MDGIGKLAEGLGKTIETVPSLYEDGLKKTVKETGDIVSLVPKSVNAALAPLRQWIMQKEYNVSETEKLISIKLQNISPENIVSPESYVAVPAIQAISYCMDSEELREMYAKLLSKAMVTSHKNMVHPSFVEIIKQLSPDEAKLLKFIANNNDSYPLLNVKRVNGEGGYQMIVKHFTNIAEGVCENPDNIYAYLDNFERLMLITIPWGVYLIDEEVYIPLIEHEDIKKIQETSNLKGWKIELEKAKFEITDFGKLFIDVCVRDL